MNCREFESHIQSFIVGELPDEKYDAFMEHYNRCKECNEELEILYLVHHAINNKEPEKGVFNLKEDLKIHLKNMENQVYRRYKYNFLKNSVITLAECTACLAGIVFILRLFHIIE